MGAHTVLCAYDTSEVSQLAARAAAWLAHQLGAPLELVHVVNHEELPVLSRRGPIPLLDAPSHDDLEALEEHRTESRARAELDAAAWALDVECASVTVLTGWPPRVLRRHAAEQNAALLVTGATGRRGFEHILHGSVSGELATEAPCPVVTVPPDAALGEPGPLLVGDDGSNDAHRAVRHAQALAKRLGRELVRLQVEDGDPAEELARAAREQRACLAVAGRRGRGPLTTEILGSVSTGLVRTAGRPVMLVSRHTPAPEEDSAY